MNITIEAKDFDLTPAIKAYVEEKLGKLTKFSTRMERIGVQLDIERANRNGLINRIEVWIYLPEKTLQVGLKAEHMNEAIDLAYEKMERQIVNYEGKRRDMARGKRG